MLLISSFLFFPSFVNYHYLLLIPYPLTRSLVTRTFSSSRRLGFCGSCFHFPPSSLDAFTKIAPKLPPLAKLFYFDPRVAQLPPTVAPIHSRATDCPQNFSAQQHRAANN